MLTAWEFYCGIGGAAAAMRSFETRITQAFDIDATAIALYRELHPTHPTRVVELVSWDPEQQSIRSGQRVPGADFWWLSPPCLPFTRRGNQKDLDDRRNASLMHLIDCAVRLQPNSLVIENVPPFIDSLAAQQITERLATAGYHLAWEKRCPTELGWPMKRRRCFLLASRQMIPAVDQEVIKTCTSRRSLRDVLASCRQTCEHETEDSLLALPEAWLRDYSDAIHLVDEEDDHATVTCFTSAYGKSPVRSGSYLRKRDGRVRLFAPEEIAALMGLPWKPTFGRVHRTRTLWSLLGNSVSVPVATCVLSRVLPRRTDGTR